MESQPLLLAQVTVGEKGWEDKLAALVALVAETVRLAEKEGSLPPWPVRGPTRRGATYYFWTSSRDVCELFSFVGTEPWPDLETDGGD